MSGEQNAAVNSYRFQPLRTATFHLSYTLHLQYLLTQPPSSSSSHLTYHITSYSIHLLPCTPHKFFTNYFSSYTAHHITFLFQLFPVLHVTSPPFFSYFRLTHHITSLFQLFPVLHIASPPFFSYFRLTHHITSLFQLFSVLHITSPPFFSNFPPYTSHYFPFSAISRLAHHITSLLQLFPALHSMSPPLSVTSNLIHQTTSFSSYFPSYTTLRTLIQQFSLLHAPTQYPNYL